MPDAQGNIKGIALGGKAAEAWERIFGQEPAGPLTEDQFFDAMEKVTARAERPPLPYPHNHLVRVDPAPEGAGSEQD